MGKSSKLFQEFAPVSREEWENKIQQDLKGAPYKKLITPTPEEIDIKPYYHSEDLQGLDYLNTLPGHFPYNRSSRIQLNDWEIRNDIIVDDFSEANKKALVTLNRGATALGFIFPDRIEITIENFRVLLHDIYYECIQINFISHKHANKIVKLLGSLTRENNIPGDRIMGSVETDLLGIPGRMGIVPDSLPGEFKKLAATVKDAAGSMPFLKTIAINACDVHNAGGSAVQELGVMLAQISEYIDKLTAEELTIDEIGPAFQVNFATGSSYFMEIAKIRAARLLFANLIRAWGPQKERSERVFIHTSTSEWNQTIYDPYVNMLRGTTEGMSAALGGANSITITPFDKSFRQTTRFSERIARNTQVILKEEAHLNKVVDPSGGSYYIESLTDSLANEAWKLFLETEDEGGYLESLKKGFIQNRIKETARKRDLNIATRRETLLGTNQYPNSTEKIHEDFNKNIAFPDNLEPSGPIDFEAYEKYRGAMAFEELRLSVERSSLAPVVFLLTIGNVNWRKARAGFASSFFACAGYKIIDNIGFDTVDEGMKSAARSKADIIVLCSSDDEYPEFARQAVSQNNENSILIIAGYPKDSMDELKKTGIEHFIHMKSNILEELKIFNKKLKIHS